MQMESHISLRSRVGFDPVHRLNEAKIASELKAVAENPVMSVVLDAAGADMLIVNRQLQIVAANHRINQDENIPCLSAEAGQRIGEAYSCINAKENPAGCGAAPNCAYCGALNTILSSVEKGEVATGECTIRTASDGIGAAEFSVTVTPITIQERVFMVVSLLDISDRKRRELWERLFVHDLKNALQGIIGWSDLLAENPTDETETTAAHISALTHGLAEEIETHRLLMAAESKQLKAAFQDVPLEEILLALKSIFSHHTLAYDKRVVFPGVISDRAVHTDPTVLRRVLVNMITNALEATPKNGEVRVEVTEGEGCIRFSVWNDGVILPEVSAHIFKRSFSTKAAAGRGLGTYSMKLFGEDVLGGKVSFSSKRGKGTVFSMELFDPDN
jgi:hypothetical protein